MKVCYFGTYRSNYVRNKLMISCLRSRGIQVIECHVHLWRGMDNRLEMIEKGWKLPRFWIRFFWSYLLLVWKYIWIESHDIMIIGYPGHLDILLGWILSKFRRNILIWDFFISIYLVLNERQMDKKNPSIVRVCQLIERISLNLSDIIITLTKEYSDWIISKYNIPKKKIRILALSTDEAIYKKIPSRRIDPSTFLCVFYGTFNPTHSVNTIIETAELLTNENNIKFKLIGSGPEYIKISELLKTKRLNNVELTGWIQIDELIEIINQADLCLGTFGKTLHAEMTLQNKIIECLAIGKPVLTGDSAHIRKIFQIGSHLYVCDRENPKDLAKTILHLKSDPKSLERISIKGHKYYLDRFSSKQFCNNLVEILNETIE